VRFLIDRCAGRRLAQWLEHVGHDVVESRALGVDPGDEALLGHAHRDRRVLVTIDTDFGRIVFAKGARHAGVVRLPDVAASGRQRLMAEVLERYSEDLLAGAVVTVRRGRIRVSRPPG
jgi:predicted nuclease of predicted toxin-antitoxin system